MNKIAIPALILAAACVGCRTHELTPDESWSDYGMYYAPTGVTPEPYAGPVDFRTVATDQSDANVRNLTDQGYAVLGCFKIADGTDITPTAVEALARKLQAGAVVWSSHSRPSIGLRGPNPDPGIPGSDYTQMAKLRQERPDQTFAEQTIRHHTIYMLGKKK